MFSKIKITKSTGNYSEQIEKLKEALAHADALVIGAGAGLSASAGFAYDGERFRQYFSDFEKRYGFHDMYSGGFYPYITPEEYWAYWSRYILINRYSDAPKPVYRQLFDLVNSKDYFVITTNVDHCFQKAGFDKKRLFYTQGDYGLLQCVDGCDGKTYDNEQLVRKMAERQKDMKIPPELIPKCPSCLKPMTMNLRCDSSFVEDEGWRQASMRYAEFLCRHEGSRVLYLELGVGGNTPEIIKYPFWRLSANNANALYACVNMGEAVAPEEIRDRAICIDGDAGGVIRDLNDAANQNHR